MYYQITKNNKTIFRWDMKAYHEDGSLNREWTMLGCPTLGSAKRNGNKMLRFLGEDHIVYDSREEK